ncbi:unnamed protein product [Lactuca saligna]|uniref:Uncharacterized protein n=1 Tax=Lactuca saligna TaxID=75948 RepID=A0AA36E1M9_LACSI|nr:unnamed protein product [Lactuca saligna]
MINIHHPLMPRGCVFQGGCYKDEVQIFKRFSKKEYFLKFWYSFHGSSTLATQILRRRHECISCEQHSRSSSKNFVFIGASNKHLSLSNGTPSSSFRGSPFDNNQKILLQKTIIRAAGRGLVDVPSDPLESRATRNLEKKLNDYIRCQVFNSNAGSIWEAKWSWFFCNQKGKDVLILLKRF